MWNSKKCMQGFTLIEMMVVLAIIAILCVFAIPSTESPIVRKQILESLELIDDFKKTESLFYKASLLFPINNAAAGIPKPEFILGNYISRVELVDGAFHLYFGKKASTVLQNKVLSVRPMVVIGSAESPISWVCGNSAVPEGMMAKGDNKTTIDPKHLPINCRI